MTQTRQEIRVNWNKQNITRYTATLHNEHDKNIIEYVEKQRKNGESVSNIIRNALENTIENGK